MLEQSSVFLHPTYTWYQSLSYSFFLWGQSMSLCNMVSKGPTVHAQDKWTQSTGKVKNLWETLAKWKAGEKHEAVKEKLVAMKLFPPYIPHTTLVMNPRLCDEKQID